MKKPAIIILLICLANLSGCVIVRTGAATILTFRSQTQTLQSVSLGFRETIWAVVDGEPTVIGRGWHPREHETYAFFINEPYPAYQPRWLLIKQSASSQAYDVDLWLWANPFNGRPATGGIEFKGKINFARVRTGKKFSLKLDNLALTSTDGQMQIFVSGKIEAKPKSSERVREQLESRFKEMQKLKYPGK